VAASEWQIQVPLSATRSLNFHGTVVRGPGFISDEDAMVQALRQVCHRLIDHIDGRGLQDVCQSLAEFYEYYRPTERSAPMLPELQARHATVGSRAVQAAFRIEED
jgi:predicted component of type VI protein secretion system